MGLLAERQEDFVQLGQNRARSLTPARRTQKSSGLASPRLLPLGEETLPASSLPSTAASSTASSASSFRSVRHSPSPLHRDRAHSASPPSSQLREASQDNSYDSTSSSSVGPGQRRRGAGAARPTIAHRVAVMLNTKDLLWTQLCMQHSDDAAERLVCCWSKDDFWSMFDSFDCMDRRDIGAVRRADFIWALGEHGTSVTFQKAIQRAGLTSHFHSTADDLSLDCFIRLSFPNATVRDFTHLMRWARLRKAHLLATHSFLNKTDLERCFDLLRDIDSEAEGVELSEILRARLLSIEELRAALSVKDDTSPLDLEEFTEHLAPVLRAKYAESKRTTRTTPRLQADAYCLSSTSSPPKKSRRCGLPKLPRLAGDGSPNVIGIRDSSPRRPRHAASSPARPADSSCRGTSPRRLHQMWPLCPIAHGVEEGAAPVMAF